MPRYVVMWKALPSGMTGHGEPMFYNEAYSTLILGRVFYSGFGCIVFHWIEEIDEERTSVQSN